MSKIYCLVFALLLILKVSTPSLASTSRNFPIEMGENGFSPSEMKIDQNDTITFKNVGSLGHWPASNIHPTHSIYPEFDPKKPVPAGKSWSFTFDRIGTWKFHDHLYPQFTGTITVVGTEAVTGTSEPSIFSKIFSFFENLFPKKDTQYDPLIKKDSTAIFTDDKALYSYIKKFGAKDTIAQLHSLELQGFGDCHQRAHKTGRLSFGLIKNAAFKEIKTFECHSGYFHGVMEAFFKANGTDKLTNNLRMICGYEKNPFVAHQCFHGIGHGLTAWSNYDLPESLRYCDLLPERKESCYSGVFMENVVGALGLDDAKSKGVNLADKHISRYLSGDPLYPCNAVDKKYQGTCYFFQTSRMIQIFGPDFARISTTCQSVPNQYQFLCFMSMGRDASGLHQKNITETVGECDVVSDSKSRINCFDGAAEDIFWDPSAQDLALNFCNLLKSPDEKKSCYMTVFSRAPQVLLARTDLANFCSKSAVEYQGLCKAYINQNFSK